MALLRERGAEGVSVRGIAGRLGVVPTAVYTYFPNRAAVLGALVDRVLGQVRVPPENGMVGNWRAQVTAMACALRAQLLAEPGVVALMAGVPLRGPHALALGEALLDVLADGGLDATAAARASYALQVYVLGAVALDVAEDPGPGPLRPEAERVAERRAALTGLAADPFPRTAAAVDTIAGYVTEEQFRWGLDRFLDGLTAG
jgi:AcrR family transcriptional regulator